jgi:serine/threonine protein kinase
MGSLRRRGSSTSSRSGARGFTPVGGAVSDGAGVLIAARSEASGALVDIRILAPALKTARALMRRVGGDMGVLREVRHTNLVSVMQFDKRAGAVVYEAVPGSTLTQLLWARGPLELPASLVLLEDCISGLEALHNAGVLHRNLTPDSVVVETTGAVLLRDAGLSAPDAATDVLAEQQPYRAPEVLAGGAPTAASDLYAATAVFVESLGGRASKSAMRAELRPLLSEGMSKDPSKRAATLDNFRRELDDYARATIGESWRKDGRALLVVAAAAHATRALAAGSPSDPPAEAMNDASAAVAALQSPAPRDLRVWGGVAALCFAVLLAGLVLLRGVSGPSGFASGFFPSNFLPFIPVSSPSVSPSQGAGPAPTSTASVNPGAVVAPIVGPTTNPTGGPRPTVGPTPTPNPALLSQVITFTSTPPSGAAYGGSYLPAAQRGASGNPVLFNSLSTGVCKSVVGNTFDFVGVGSCLIQASVAGNSRYNSATSAQSFTVSQASQKIVFNTQPSNPTYNGPSYTVQATASGGAVTFSADSSSQACTVSSGGTVNFTAAGDCIIDANQGGSADYAPAQPVQQQITVAQATQTLKITSSPPCNPCVTQMPYTLSGTASSGLQVTFGIDASSTPGSCSIAGNVVTINGGLNFPGTCVIDWFQNGNQNYSAAPAQSQSILVT